MKTRIFALFVFSCLLFAGTVFGEERFIEIRAKKFSYTPHIIKTNKGDEIRIRLISEDVRHGLFIDGYNIKTSAYPGQDGSLHFIADKTGRFSFRCSVTCGEFHPYMVGYLIVEPNSRFWTHVALVILMGIISSVFIILQKRTTPGTAPQGTVT